jgi:hypothetical protein
VDRRDRDRRRAAAVAPLSALSFVEGLAVQLAAGAERGATLSRVARPLARVALLSAACAFACGFAAVPGCKSDAGPPTEAKTLTHEQLQDPASCQSCHGDHYREWSGSMHAYASDDPLFLAMNKRAQRDTGGAIGDLCVRCHAPMALRTGATRDGTDMDKVPQALKGVTCYFCHSTTSVDGTNDAPLTLASDDVLRAGIADPMKTTAHDSRYSPLHDRDRIESAGLCGACHDVTLTSGLPIEQTYVEWKGALYAHDVAGQRLTCGACHMPGSDGLAANLPNAPTRRVHDHSVPGVDIALTPFPQTDAQRAGVQANLDPALVAKLCVQPPTAGDTVAVTLDNAFVGHDWPSGAVHDRRAWVEVTAYQGASTIFTSGAVPDGTSVDALTDPNLWLLKADLLDSQQNKVKFMWQATSENNVSLPVALTNDPNDPRYYHSVTKTYPVPPEADRVDIQVHIAPVALEVIDDLIASGDLDPSYRAKLPVFTLAGTHLEWTTAKGFGCVP